MDRIEAMNVFVAVAEEQGFAAAARRLRLSAPAVTRAVAAVEAQVGARLLHRTTREVRLTDAGARYLVASKRWLAELEEVDRSVDEDDAELRGALSVTASVMFGGMYVAPVMLELLDRHPGVQARLLFVDRVVSLAEESVDVAIRIAHLESASDMAVRLGAIRRVLVGAPGYLRKHGTPERPRDLAHHTLVAYSGGAQPTPWLFMIGGRRQPIEVRPRLVVSSSEVGVAAAVAGHGLSLALSYQVAEHVRTGSLRVVLAEYELPPVPVHVLHREGRVPSARVRAFVDLVVERLRGHPGLTLAAGRKRATRRAR